MSAYMSKEEATAKILSMVPKTCPMCGAPTSLSEDRVHLKCTNPNCSGKLYRRVEIMAKAFGIENIGLTVANELVSECNLTNLPQIFHLTKEDLLNIERFGDGMATKLYNSIKAVKQVNWSDFIRGAQIPRVGDGTSKEVAKVYKSLEELLKTSKEELAKRLPRMTTESTGPIVEALRAQEEEIRALAECVEIVYPAEPVQVKQKNITAVVTGKLSFGSRPAFQEKYGSAYGVKWGSSVSSNTDILVTNESSSSSKYKAALSIQEQGGKIQIMTEEEFIKYMEV